MSRIIKSGGQDIHIDSALCLEAGTSGGGDITVGRISGMAELATSGGGNIDVTLDDPCKVTARTSGGGKITFRGTYDPKVVKGFTSGGGKVEYL